MTLGSEAPMFTDAAARRNVLVIKQTLSRAAGRPTRKQERAACFQVYVGREGKAERSKGEIFSWWHKGTETRTVASLARGSWVNSLRFKKLFLSQTSQ